MPLLNIDSYLHCSFVRKRNRSLLIMFYPMGMI